MAAGRHNPSRRALLGAHVGLPRLPRHCEERSDEAIQGGGGVSAGLLRNARNDGARWERAFDRFREVEARLAAAAHSEDEGLYDRLGARHDSAVKALLRAPAPSLAALAVKVDLLILEQAWEMTGGELCLQSLRRDVHRFAGG